MLSTINKRPLRPLKNVAGCAKNARPKAGRYVSFEHVRFIAKRNPDIAVTCTDKFIFSLEWQEMVLAFVFRRSRGLGSLCCINQRLLVVFIQLCTK